MELLKGDNIPNGEHLYKYVKSAAFPRDQTAVPYTIFQDSRSSSFDWAMLQLEPEKSFHIDEGRNIIVRTEVCDEIRYPTNPKRNGARVPDWEQKIIYDPVLLGEDVNHPTIENPSHALVEGLKKPPITKVIADHSILWMRIENDAENQPPVPAMSEPADISSQLDESKTIQNIESLEPTPNSQRIQKESGSLSNNILGFSLIIAFFVILLAILVIVFWPH